VRPIVDNVNGSSSGKYLATASRIESLRRVLNAFLKSIFHIRRPRTVRRELGHQVTAQLVSTLILSRLDYCNAVLAGLPVSTLASLKRVLNAAARLVLELGPRDHVSAALRELHWLPIRKRIDYKLCPLAHDVRIGHTPEYMSELLTATSGMFFKDVTTLIEQWRLHRSCDAASTRWSRLLCCCRESMEHAADRVEINARHVHF
jgi:hypothetical protein